MAAAAAAAAAGALGRTLRLALLALLACAALPRCAAIPYFQDELLWTKQNWQEYKLPFPWSGALKEKERERTRQLQGPLRPFQLSSMNGPLLDGKLLEQLAQEDARRPPLGAAHQSQLDITLLDETASQEAAAGVAQCKVCGSLIKQLWEGATRWVDRQQQVPSKKRLAAYAAELCEYEVPNDVLKGWVLLRARVQPSAMQPVPVAAEEAGDAAGQAQGQEFYLLSQRAKQHATPTEIDSVRLACKALLREDGAGAERNRQLLHLTSSMVHQYYRQLMKLVQPGMRLSVWHSVEAVDDGPSAQRVCFDRHPQCELWKKKGECGSNPKYMVGDGPDGWCRLTCGACTPEKDPDSGLSDTIERKMGDAKVTSLQVLQAQACLQNVPCKWAAGAGMAAALAKARKGAGPGDGEAVKLMQEAAYISGPVMSRQQQLEAALDADRLKETKPMLQRTLKDAVVSEPRIEQEIGKLALPPPPQQQQKQGSKEEEEEGEAGQVLARELADKCLYVNTGWWMYQLCYKRHITQFHMTEKLEVDWVISLGQYQASSWQPGTALDSELYPPQSKVPYVAQTYVGGNKCDLDQADPKSGAPRTIPRRSELRLLCSPDPDTHITIREPEQCVYLIELYLPQLCRAGGFVAELPAGMADSLDSAWNGHAAAAGPDGVAAAEGTAAEAQPPAPAGAAAGSQQQPAQPPGAGAANKAAARAAKDEEEDSTDPYEDPPEDEEDEYEDEDSNARDEL